MFNKAIQNRKLERNPLKGVKLLRENNERERVLSAEEWEAYRANCPPWYLPVAVTAYRTAMRKSEIANLSPSRVVLNEEFIRLRPEDTKTGNGRSIPIHPELMEILRDALNGGCSNNGNVFHRDCDPVNAGDIRRAHRSTCKKAKIENFTFHNFRHTCINNWRKEGHDYFRIMAVSGHKTISVFKRYNLVDERELKSLVNGKDRHKENKNSELLPQSPLPQLSIHPN